MNLADRAHIEGVYTVRCFDPSGRLKWEQRFPNLVVTTGLNQLADAALPPFTPTVAVYAGLISGTGFTGIAASDTMLLHPGWVECGNANAPTLIGPRKQPAWSLTNAGVKTWTTAQTWSVAAFGGPVAGAFQVFGAGALSAIDSTAGILFSAGAFPSPQTVDPADIINVSYGITL